MVNVVTVTDTEADLVWISPSHLSTCMTELEKNSRGRERSHPDTHGPASGFVNFNWCRRGPVCGSFLLFPKPGKRRRATKKESQSD